MPTILHANQFIIQRRTTNLEISNSLLLQLGPSSIRHACMLAHVRHIGTHGHTATSG
jgi:hypothetical protein